jgi:hypothetical protein
MHSWLKVLSLWVSNVIHVWEDSAEYSTVQRKYSVLFPLPFLLAYANPDSIT